MNNEQVKWIVGAILAVGIAIVIALASHNTEPDRAEALQTACMSSGGHWLPAGAGYTGTDGGFCMPRQEPTTIYAPSSNTWPAPTTQFACESTGGVWVPDEVGWTGACAASA